MTLDLWLAYLGAAVLISVSPGAGAVTSMSSGLAVGLRRGMWNILGLQIALVGQVVLVAVGLGAVVTSSEAAFEAIRWAGVAYLVWLAIQQWRARPHDVEAHAGAGGKRGTSTPTDMSARALVVRGFLVNASNPKAIVFMLAVLPQFVRPDRPLLPQYAAITATSVAVDVAVMIGYTGLAATVLAALRSPRQQMLVNRGLAAGLALAAILLATVHH